MENNILTLCAYHESGRVVFAYLCGFTCDGIELSATDPGRGMSKLNGGQDTALIQQILGGNPLVIAPENRNKAIEVAQHLMEVYCAGTCARIYFEQEGKIGTDVELDVPVQDEKPIHTIQQFLTGINPGHDTSFPAKKMAYIFQKLKDAGAWKAIHALATTAINSSEKSLTRFEIEDALMAGGLKIRRVASSGFNVGLSEEKKKIEEPAAQQTRLKEFESESTADILLKDFFRKIRKDWGEEEVNAAARHVKEIIARY